MIILFYTAFIKSLIQRSHVPNPSVTAVAVPSSLQGKFFILDTSSGSTLSSHLLLKEKAFPLLHKKENRGGR